ncbi:MAG: tRNA (adenosine(37)-N6)-threonylcarbamoyltransferase complex dimerization subunit type 1 TsaB [Myxococcota bacterium]
MAQHETVFDMKQPWLLLDTSSPQGVVAVWQDGLVCAQMALPHFRQHAEMLSGAVSHCLKQARVAFHELAGIAVGQGPGSFVGVRIAMAHAKGMACALGIGMVGVPTLLALAAGESKPVGQRVLVLLDARRAQVFAQQVLYLHMPECSWVLPVAQGCPVALSQKQVMQETKQVDCVIACRLQQAWLDALGSKQIVQVHGPTAVGMGRMLVAHLAQEGLPDRRGCGELQPVYVRSPDARLPTGRVI